MKFSLKQKKRSAVSPVIATLLLIAIAVAAAIIVYAFVTGLIGGLSSGAGSSLVAVTGTLSVPGGAGSGTLVFSVKNGANNPITELAFTMPIAAITSYTDGANSFINPGSAVQSLVSVATGAGVTVPVSPTNPLNIGATASGALTVSGPSGNGGLNAGSTYTFTVTITYQNGGSAVQSVDVTAQL
ncbi:MAG: hypothetical protein OK456_10345 [Thaumarchaeota archaeon]|nr:hypothetical protein [Nitrososphaerota archaeon]